MIHTRRRALVALPLSLLLAGCGGSRGTEFRSASQALPPAHTTAPDAPGRIDRGASDGDVELTASPDQRPGDTAAVESRYDITLDEIREHVRSNTAVIIDARGAAGFAGAHVHGALNVPVRRKEAYVEQIHQGIATDQLIIIYCNGPLCDSGDMVYEYLESEGFTNMRVFKPGWEALSVASDLW